MKSLFPAEWLFNWIERNVSLFRVKRFRKIVFAQHRGELFPCLHRLGYKHKRYWENKPFLGLCCLSRVCISFENSLKGQCPDYAHARASSVFSSKDNRTLILTRQDFLPDRTADRDLLFIFSSNILDFQRSISFYIKIWLAVRRLIAILSLAGPPRDPKISFRSL